MRITIDTEGTDYNDRALNEEEAHYMPMKADPSIRIVLNSSQEIFIHKGGANDETEVSE